MRMIDVNFCPMISYRNSDYCALNIKPNSNCVYCVSRLINSDLGVTVLVQNLLIGIYLRLFCF